ncbi:kinase-like domain-containing protein [Flagelloscypha sp. PMI_526]|nr:kinase-like domain-containing protein [Flagelloscypha sp. PMI_526]
MSQNFLREVALWSTWEHDHITPCLGISFQGQNMATPAVVMPWYDHGSLIKFLSIYPRADKLAFILQVADAVGYLHSLNIAHGDIKAQNVLVTSNSPPHAVLADFGLSRPLNGIEGFETSYIQGTLHFMAPELLQHLIYDGLYHDRQCTKETDIWAFGMFIVQVFTGRLPLTLPPNRCTEFELAHLVVMDGYLPSPKDSPEVPSRVWQSGILRKCWECKAKKRMAMEQIMKVLSEIYEG